MKKLILLFIFLSNFIFASSTSVKIKDSKKTLSVTVKAKKKTNRQLGKIAKDIQSAEADIIYLEKKIDTLERTRVQSEIKYKKLQAELAFFEKEYARTNKQLEIKNKEFITLLSEQLSIAFAMEQAHEPTAKSILQYEAYQAYKDLNTKSLKELRSDIATLNKSKKSNLYLRNKIKKDIDYLNVRKNQYSKKKKEKEALLKRLSQDEEKYNTKLEKIVDKQNSLRATLAKLNILRSKEVEKARRLAAAKKEAMRLEKQRQRKIRKAKALARLKARKAKEALLKATTEAERASARKAAREAEAEKKKVYKESEKIRQVNSSYTKSKTYKYRGRKTISPLVKAKVIKKFGTYVDPIYKIKIFNESVTLKSSIANAKVRNVLNGKIVYAGKSSMLGNVVVVSHSKRIHTVYAGLSKIAPTIKQGKKIKKGYIVGRINEKLIFQATKNSKHINPLRLIRL